MKTRSGLMASLFMVTLSINASANVGGLRSEPRCQDKQLRKLEARLMKHYDYETSLYQLELEKTRIAADYLDEVAEKGRAFNIIGTLTTIGVVGAASKIVQAGTRIIESTPPLVARVLGTLAERKVVGGVFMYRTFVDQELSQEMTRPHSTIVGVNQEIDELYSGRTPDLRHSKSIIQQDIQKKLYWTAVQTRAALDEYTTTALQYLGDLERDYMPSKLKENTFIALDLGFTATRTAETKLALQEASERLQERRMRTHEALLKIVRGACKELESSGSGN